MKQIKLGKAQTQKPMQSSMQTNIFEPQSMMSMQQKPTTTTPRVDMSRQVANVPGIDTSIGGIAGVNTPTISPTIQKPGFMQGVRTELQQPGKDRQRVEMNRAIGDFETQNMPVKEQVSYKSPNMIQQAKPQPAMQDTQLVKDQIRQELQNIPELQGIEISDELLDGFLSSEFGMKYAQPQQQDILQGGLRRGAARESEGRGNWERLNPIGKVTEIVDNVVQKIPTISRESIAQAFEGTPFEGMEVFPTMVANIPGSLLKTASATARGIANPFDTIAGLAQLATTEEGQQMLIDRYGSIDNLKETMAQDPVGLASDFLTLVQGGANLVSKGARLGGATRLADVASDVGRVAGTASDLGMNIPISRGLNQLKTASKITGTETVPQKILKTAGQLTVAGTEPLQTLMENKIPQKVGSTIKKGASNVANYTINSLTQTTPEMRKFVFDNPRLIKEISKNDMQTNLSNIGREVNKAVNDVVENRNEIGQAYKVVEDANINFDASSISNRITDFLDSRGITIKENGKLDFGKSEIGAKGNMSAIQNAFNKVKDLKNITSKEILRLRRAIDDTINYKTDTDTKGQRIVKEIRRIVDEVAGENIPGLKEIDTQYKPVVEQLQKIQKQFLDKQGNIKPEAEQRLTQLLQPKNIEKLKLLDNIIPDFSRRLEAIKVANEFKTASERTTGASVRGILGSVAGFSAGGPIGAIAGRIATNPGTVKMIASTSGKIKQMITGIQEGKKDIKPKDMVDLYKAIESIKSKEATVIQAKRDFKKIMDNIGKQQALPSPETVTPSNLGTPDNPIVSKPLLRSKNIIENTPASIKKGEYGPLREIQKDVSEYLERPLTADEIEYMQKLDKQLQSMNKTPTTQGLERIDSLDRFKQLQEMVEDNKKQVAKDFEDAVYQSIQKKINKTDDVKAYNKFVERVQKIESKEQLIGKVGNKQVGATYKDTQKRTHETQKEALIQEIQQHYSIDQFEARDMYDKMVNERNKKPLLRKNANQKVSPETPKPLIKKK